MKENKVYIAMGTINYEGDHIIGVFDSEEKAQARIDADLAEQGWHYDDYFIDENEVQ